MADTENKIYLSSSPHFKGPITTNRIMWLVVLALLPVCIGGVCLFGLRALAVIAISVIASLGFEFLFNLLVYKNDAAKKWSIKDGSAVITGLLLACTLPPTLPFWQVVLGAAFAVIVVKGFFGGLGNNIWNPALAGRAFLMICFPAAMGASWMEPGTDAISSATILSTKAVVPLKDLLLGYRAGCIGETCTLIIILAGLFLICIRLIDWRIPVSFIGTVALCTLLAGGDVPVALLSGGLMLGAFFMATDYVTSPITMWGRVIFGIGCGLITFLIRQFGGYPEGVMFSILFMNCFYPFLNNLKSRMYGYGKKGGAK